MKKMFCGTAVTILVALLTVGCSKKEENTLYLFNWTYYTPDAVIKQFEKEFDVRVHIDNYASNEEMYTKIKAGGTGYDIVFPSQDYASIMINQGMLEELDHSKIPNVKYINPIILEKLSYDSNMQYAVPYGMTISGIAVNTEKLSEYERSWNIFAREDLKDRMSMLDDMREVVSASLLSLGYSVNTTNDLELAQAEHVLKNEWAPNLVKFDAEGFGKAFSAGDFWVSHGYAENIFGEIPEEHWDKVDYFIPEEGVPLYIDSMCILKGTKNYELAMDFINFIHRPEVYALFLDDFRFPAVINEEAGKFTEHQPMYEIDDVSAYQVPADIGEDISKYDAIWERVRFGN